MANVGITITRDDISPALSRLIATARNPLPVMRAMGTTFKSITEGAFNSVGARYRPKPWPAKRGGEASILQKSTTLAKSFHLAVTPTTATLSNPTPYAAIHQFGGVIRPVTAKRLSWVASNGQRIFAMKVTIPARPFYPIDGGRLTAAAEEKIARAGERALARQITGAGGNP